MRIAVISILTGCLWLCSSTNANAEVLSFSTIVTESLDQSYDLMLNATDVRLSHNEVKKVATDYLPQIRAQANLEYLKDLTNGQTPVAVVGTTTVPNTTRWQSLVYLNANYTVFDFGARGKLLNAARLHRDATYGYGQQHRRDIKLDVIEKYSSALTNYHALKAKEKILDLQRNIFQMKKRLNIAGRIGKVEVADAGTELAKTFSEIYDLKQALVTDLQALSVYTHHSYDVEKIEITPFETPSNNSQYVFTVELAPEYRIYNAEINRKKNELAALKAQRYPVISVYSNFYMYGYDRNGLNQTFRNFQGRTISGGISASLPIFDAFKNKLEREKKELEIKRIGIERDKKLWELQEQHGKITSAVAMYSKQVQSREKLLAEDAEKVVMAKRLSDHELVEKTQYLAKQTELIEYELELDKTRIQQIASIKKLQALSEG